MLVLVSEFKLAATKYSSRAFMNINVFASIKMDADAVTFL